LPGSLKGEAGNVMQGSLIRFFSELAGIFKKISHFFVSGLFLIT